MMLFATTDEDDFLPRSGFPKPPEMARDVYAADGPSAQEINFALPKI
jgi:hypothetical protein